MNQNLINQYGISFVNRLINIPGFKPFFEKCPITNSAFLSDFLGDWKLIDIQDYLIPEINKVLEGIEPEFETASDTFIVIVGPVFTVFYLDDVGTNYPKIPTQDFFEILIGWSNYLSE